MIKRIPGTKDVLPSEIDKWHFIENIVHKIFHNYNYGEIRTPIFEETPLFARGIGEETDIVSKEMYTFNDRGGTSVTLKPEMTAAVVRAFIEHNFDSKQSLNKLYYISPMFRQERPQAGRLRQFHQFGAEVIGSNSPLLDAEIIIIAYRILSSLGLKAILLKINTLGKPLEREKFKNALKEYLYPHFEKLSDDSKKRFSGNILRIFDSKDASDVKIMSSAPNIQDYLSESGIAHFEKVRSVLDKASVPFEVEPKLVRGLDYYTDTTFEILSGKVGSQNALCGGGRYDNLIETLGGKNTPGVGFAAGIERIILALDNENALKLTPEPLDYFIIRLNDDSANAFSVAQHLRDRGFSVELDYLDRSVKAQMREANKLNAEKVVFIGGEEEKDGLLTLKFMKTGEQVSIKPEMISEYKFPAD
ncbi:MAG: histidine--tRNA ligase [Ignavibacteriales bacterium]|mgnify:CR=1 FL=1|jgi:histidyl-tRNA synthetase|nr:histidine--tRNA ligase [Ignavibacteriaceae bacterium]NLH62431.1 histidine--tRNA ligase [Ignavibacteriales bacterium]HOJ18678.1 histidine--tRNA ligase [Ignavibacteriaceae bacterium]